VGFLRNLFGRSQSDLWSRIAEVESAVRSCVADFKDRTQLSYALIFPIMQAVAVRLYVQELGVSGTAAYFENVLRVHMRDRNIKQSQIDTFASPEIPPEFLPRTTELNAFLWKLANELAARGYDTTIVAGALVNISMEGAERSLEHFGSFYAAGLVMVSLKALRAGVYG
jgi:hypothetical protein